VFQTAEHAEATARLSGVVLRSDRRVNAITDQPFVVARVRTVGFETDVCMSGVEWTDALSPGNVVSGRVFLAGSLSNGHVVLATRVPPAPVADVKRRWWRPSRG
jgi:hypothetical protein